jgi:hypothetical protein
MDDSLSIHSASLLLSSLTKDVLFHDQVRGSVKTKPVDNVL